MSKSRSGSARKSPVKDVDAGNGRSSSKVKNVPQDDSEREPSLAFKVLNEQQAQELLGIDDVDELEKKMVVMMNLPSHLTDLKEGAILDYYVSAVWWSKEQSFNAAQASAFFSAIHSLLDNVKEKHLSLAENVLAWKKMLIGVASDQESSTGALDCLNSQHAQLMTDYINQSLFQHYKMYEFMFTHTQAEEIIGTDLELHVAKPCDLPWPPPLDEGITAEIHAEYVATPPPSPVLDDVSDLDGRGSHLDEGEPEVSEDGRKEADLLASLTREEITKVMNSVAKEMLGGLQTEIAAKLRERENSIINRINKIHIQT